MKTLLTIATAALTAATFAAGPKEGQSRGPGRGPMEGLSDPIVRLVTNPRMAEKIGLTEDQQNKIKEINKSSRGSMDELRKTLRDSMARQTELLKADKIDEGAVMAEIDKAFDARKEMAKRQTRRIIAIKSILTPEQVAKALEEIKNRPKREPKGMGARSRWRDGDRPQPPRNDDAGERPNPPEA